MYLIRSLLFFIVATMCILTTTAQTPAPAPVEKTTDDANKNEARLKVETQAYDLLDAVLKDIQRLRLPQNRAFLFVTVAELVWEHDEQLARSLFKDAMADLRAILNEIPGNDPRRFHRERGEKSRLREKVLMALARRDARMARDFLVETRPLMPQESEYQVKAEAEFETRLALVIAANDPEQALEMARKILAKGFTDTLPNLVTDLQKKDRETAAMLAGDILAKLKTVKLTTNQAAANVAIRVFQLATAPQKTTPKTGANDAKPLLSEQSLRELADMIAVAAIEASPENDGRAFNIGPIITQLEKYAPSRTQQLRKYSAQNGGENDEAPWQVYQRLSESGTVETLIAAAEKDPGMSEAFYTQAATKLVNEEKIDRARQLITENVKNPDRRKQILADLDRQILAAAAKQGKIDETRKLLTLAGSPEERIALLAQLAAAVAVKGDKKTAIQLLEEARGLGPDRVRYARQMLAQMQIARAYASVDPAQSLTITEATIDQLNELISAAILLGEFIGEEEIVRDDEVLIFMAIELSDLIKEQFGKDLALLSNSNFTRTRDAADRFQRFEVRIMARLLVVQSVLSQKEEKKGDILTPPEEVKTEPDGP